MKNVARVIACVAALLWAALAVQANDSAVEGTGGTVTPLGREHPSVRMVRETVQIDLYPAYYETVADFTFANGGAAAMVTMGFPESGAGDVNPSVLQKKPSGGFLRFATSVDGAPFAARRVPSKSDQAGESYQAYWVKKVPFARHQTRHVQVRLRCPYGGMASGGMRRWAAYTFTGGNWRGKVDRSVLTVRLHEPGTFLVAPRFTDRQDKTLAPGWMAQQGTTFSHTFRHWEAEGDFAFYLGKTAPGWLALPGEPIDGRPDYLPVTKIPVVTVPGKIPSQFLGYDYTPPALQADGITYLSLLHMEALLASLTKARGIACTVSGETTDQATLSVGNTSFAYRAGSKTVLVNGQEMPLPAPPKRVRDRLRDQLLMYVPLAPLLEMINAQAEVRPTTHSIMVRPRPAPQHVAAMRTGNVVRTAKG